MMGTLNQFILQQVLSCYQSVYFHQNQERSACLHHSGCDCCILSRETCAHCLLNSRCSKQLSAKKPDLPCSSFASALFKLQVRAL